MPIRIAVCYRRDDATHPATLLFDRLRQAFPGQVSISSSPGAPPRDPSQSATVLLPVIGPDWANGTWLSDSGDETRNEIANALSRDIPIIPALVRGASMPEESQLPSDLEPLLDFDPFTLRDADWEYDCEQLVKELKATITGLRMRRFVPLGLGALGAILAVVIALVFGLNAYHNHRIEEARKAMLQDILATGNLENKPIAMPQVPAALSGTEWEGTVKPQDPKLSRFDEIGSLHFHERTVDIETSEVHSTFAEKRVACLVGPSPEDILISCQKVEGALRPVSYRLRAENDRLTGIMVVYCIESRLKELCPENGMLFYDVVLKRAQGGHSR
jgi:hypothetical protein